MTVLYNIEVMKWLMGSKNKKAQMKYKQFDMEYHVYQVFQAEQSYPWEIHRTADFLLAMNLILED